MLGGYVVHRHNVAMYFILLNGSLVICFGYFVAYVINKRIISFGPSPDSSKKIETIKACPENPPRVNNREGD